MSKKARKLISMLLCFTMLFSCVGVSPAFAAEGSADGDDQTITEDVNIGSNPKPAVDIAVSVPPDYPGGFPAFRKALTQELKEKGLDPSLFRITDTMVKIDTTDLNGWYVYDHYYNNTAYTNLGLSAEQQKKQPYRVADTTYDSTDEHNKYGKPVLIQDVLVSRKYVDPTQHKAYDTALWPFNQHTYSYQDPKTDTANMVFAGYGTYAKTDFMIYPASNDSTRSIGFDLDAAVINTHTLDGAGFLLNAGIDKDGLLQGYMLYYYWGKNNLQNVQLRKIDNYNPKAQYNNGTADETFPGVTKYTNNDVTLKQGDKLRIEVMLDKDKVTLTQQNYDKDGNLVGEPKTLLDNYSLEPTGYNGFGPIVGYGHHGCSGMTVFQYSDLDMKYTTTAFDALKKVQYYENADQKYFINLVGANNDPQIPADTEQDYKDGVNRLNANEIFYLSNIDDGKIVKDTSVDEDGTVHTGLGSSNGYIATGDDYLSQLAQYICDNYKNNATFQKNENEIDSERPLAKFHMVNANGEQLMTVHQMHLLNSGQSITIKIADDSIVGTNAQEKDANGNVTSNGYIKTWHYKIYSPSGDIIENYTISRDSENKTPEFPEFVFNGKREHGTWIFELVVEDQTGKEMGTSKVSQTYITVFKDDQEPIITGANTGKNTATITLTDTGQGIADDGITFIEDNRGSGVQYYCITDDETITEENVDWIEVKGGPTHTISFNKKITSTDPLVVWAKDECGNIGKQAVFQPKHIIVKDADGDEIDDYYVIEFKDEKDGKTPIVILPDKTPESSDENEKFSGWQVGDTPVTPGSPVNEIPPTDGDKNTIVIRPAYSTDQAKLIYVANGGTIADAIDGMDMYEVTAKSSIETKIAAHKVVPTRVGHSFIGWKLLNTDNAESAKNPDYINNEQNLWSVENQVAYVEKNDKEEITRDTYYLIAQWEKEKYTLTLNANGGFLQGDSIIENIDYGTNVSELNNIPTSGRLIPTKPGYIFKGWSINASAMDDTSNIFLPADGTEITQVESPIMDSDKTIYAVWAVDNDKFIVSFDSQGGTKVNDQSYFKLTAQKYDTFVKPNKAGYTFEGWYLLQQDGTLGSTAYVGGEDIIKNENNTFKDHTFVAKWTPNEKTKYTIDYMYNTSDKYVLASSKEYFVKTESEVTVADSDILDEITVDGVKYWYNKENPNNKLNGTVTGSPTLSLKLHYDRYFDIEVTKRVVGGTGNGGTLSVSNAVNTPEDGGVVSYQVKEGKSPTITWEAEKGYHVASIKIDGKTYDKLLSANSYTFEEAGGVHENHKFEIKFVADGEEGDPSTKPDPNPNPSPTPGPGSNVVRPVLHKLEAKITGCTDGTCTITPEFVQTEATKDTYTVEWYINEPLYDIDYILVDGEPYETESGVNQCVFEGIEGDHSVEVVVKQQLSSLGGTSVTGQYTVSVNCYGGDDTIELSPTTISDAGKTVKASWNAKNSKYEIERILIDGKDGMIETDRLQSGVYNFEDIDANHVVDVYVKKTDEQKDLNAYIVNTEIIGGGSISGDKVLYEEIVDGNPNETNVPNYTVTWKDGTDTRNKNSSSYAVYETVSAVIRYADGHEELAKTLDGHELSIDVEALKEHGNANVTVVVKPKLIHVDVKKVGEGDIAVSKTLFLGQDYTDIFATPANGWILAKVQVDDDIYVASDLVDFLKENLKENSQKQEEIISKEEQADEKDQNEEAGDEVQGEQINDEVVGDDEVNDENVSEDVPTEDMIPGDDSNDESNTESFETNDVEIEENGSDSAMSDSDTETEAYTITEHFTSGNQDSDEDFSDEDIVMFADETNNDVDGTETSNETSEITVTHTGFRGISSYTDLVENHQVTAYFIKLDELTGKAQDEIDKETEEKPDQPLTEEDIKKIIEDTTDDILEEKIIENENAPKITATVVTEDGIELPGVSVGIDQDTISWKIPNGYEIVKVVDVSNSEAELEYTHDDEKGKGDCVLGTVENNTDVQIVVKKKELPYNDVVPTPSNTLQKTYEITTEIQVQGKAQGSIQGAGIFNAGMNRTVAWNASTNTVLGEDGKEYNYVVKYVFVDGELYDKTKNSVDFNDLQENHKVIVVIDLEGVSTTNIDKDGDGKPDINVDIDEDGTPDYNVDTDGDGEPDINIVVDEDGKPKPVDPKNPEKPTVNLVVDGDGEIILGKDMDPENPPTPNVNVDEDGDGNPDKNIDKDGDGIPDPEENDGDTIIPGSWCLVEIFVEENGQEPVLKEDQSKYVIYHGDYGYNPDGKGIIPDGYKVVKVLINGEEHPELIQNGVVTLKEIDENTDITFVLEKIPASSGGSSDSWWEPSDKKDPDKEDEKLKEEEQKQKEEEKQKEQEVKDPEQTDHDGTTVVEGTLLPGADGVKNPSAEEEAAKLLADKEAPRTGDDHATGFFAMLMLLAVSALAVLNRRKEDSEA